MNPFSRVSGSVVCWSVVIFLGMELFTGPVAAQEGQTTPSRAYLQDDIQSFPPPLVGEPPTFDGPQREFRPPTPRGERVMPPQIMRSDRSRQMPFELRVAQLMQIKTVLEKHGQKDIARQLEPLILKLKQEQNCFNRVAELRFAAEGLRALDQPQLADQLGEAIKQAETELEEIRSKGKEQPETPVSATPAQPKPAAPATDSTVDTETVGEETRGLQDVAEKPTATPQNRQPQRGTPRTPEEMDEIGKKLAAMRRERQQRELWGIIEQTIQEWEARQRYTQRIRQLKEATATLRELDLPNIVEQLTEATQQAETELEQHLEQAEAKRKIPSAAPSSPQKSSRSSSVPVPTATPADKLQAEVQQLQQLEALKAQVEALSKKLEEQTKTEEIVPVSGGGFF